MNITPDNEKTQSISDDQELAKVLAGVNQSADEPADSSDSGNPLMPTPPGPMPDAAATDDTTDEVAAVENNPVPEDALPEPAGLMPDAPMPGSIPSDLESIKKEALGELRPLVDKLNVSPEEKFDTYLLLLRSTDDRDLIAPAHEAAKSITDETRKAQALLDIIKEIDFLSQNQK